MTQLHALYPDWQVLEWESLLEALEMEFEKSGDDQHYDVLQEYSRPDSILVGLTSDRVVATDPTPGQSLAEHENLQVLMLTLALQMAASNLSISLLQLSRIKYCVVKSMGFQNCEKFHTSGTILVTYSNLVFKADDFSHVSMIFACTRGLKKVLDNFTPVNPESIAAIGVDAIDKFKAGLNENINYGDQFVDVVFKMFNSGVDLTQLSHLMLKIWLELILIVVYKVIRVMLWVRFF
jgi:hypothetical protein